MGWITAITNFFGLLNKLLVFIKERQLREDERNKIKVEQNEMDNQAKAKVKKIKEANASLSDDDIIVRMQDYTRK
jgi:hypothetical protein